MSQKSIKVFLSSCLLHADMGSELQDVKRIKMMINNDKLFIMAVILNFVNAKTIIFGLTVTTLYLDLGFDSNHLISFALLMGFLCYVAVIVWGLFGQLFKEVLTKYNILYTIVMAILLGYSGILIIIESIQ